MADETVTLALNGDVPIDQFATAIQHWAAMIALLTEYISPGTHAEWIIEDLQPGSATTTIRGEADDPAVLAPVRRAIVAIGRDLEADREPAYPPEIRRHARMIRQQIGPRITSIRFETPDEDVTIRPREGVTPDEEAAQFVAFGAIAGRIQTVSSRRRLGFTLYDSIFDRGVNCYLGADQQHLVADKWDKRVVVEGVVSRDPDSGRPVAIRNIVAIDLLGEDEHGDYRDAAGMFPLAPGEESATVILRRVRDEW
jgi:hypothetical protein